MTFDIGLHEVCVRTGVRYVITKFSGMDSLPNFLTHGAPLRARTLGLWDQVMAILECFLWLRQERSIIWRERPTLSLYLECNWKNTFFNLPNVHVWLYEDKYWQSTCHDMHWGSWGSSFPQFAILISDLILIILMFVVKLWKTHFNISLEVFFLQTSSLLYRGALE